MPLPFTGDILRVDSLPLQPHGLPDLTYPPMIRTKSNKCVYPAEDSEGGANRTDAEGPPSSHCLVAALRRREGNTGNTMQGVKSAAPSNIQLWPAPPRQFKPSLRIWREEVSNSGKPLL